ncbi:MAG: oxygen-independent coproporphyrinogen III oxidase [Myxococcota bacterium]
MERLTPAQLLRYSGPGPRYTSYPTVPMWSHDYPVSRFYRALSTVRSPATVYVHVPFCVEQCSFCGCNMVVAGRREPGDRYLDDLEQQINALPLPADQIPVSRIHLGGGTPTWFDIPQIERLYGMLYRRFAPIDGAEISVEADPEVTTDAQLDALAALGVSRMSFGVQSFDATVLAAVSRPQNRDRIVALVEKARSLGMGSLNIDLMYGLPHQTPARFEQTLDAVLQLRPERLAIFGYAHLPWLKPHMKKIDANALPGPLSRAGLYLQAQTRMQDAGYVPIGLDHFALPEDDLAQAQQEERLHRNFMGYTTLPDVDLIGLGMSAISEINGEYVQQRSKLARWWRAAEGVDDTALIERGWSMTDEDRLRKHVIYALMCNLVVSIPDVEARFGVRFHEHFADALARLHPMMDEGLMVFGDDALRVTERGRLLVRNAAMPFDAYLKRKTAGQPPRFSQTV